MKHTLQHPFATVSDTGLFNIAAGISVVALALSITLKPSPLGASISTAIGVAAIGIGHTKSRNGEIEALTRERNSTVQRLTAQLNEITALREKANEDLRLLDTLYTKTKGERDESAKSVTALDSQLTTLRQTASECETNTATLLATIADKQVQLTQVEARYETLCTEFDTLEATYRTQERELLRFQDNKELVIELERTQVRGETGELREKLQKLADSHTQLTAHATQSKEIVGELRTEFDYLSGDGYDELHSRHLQSVATLTTEIDTLTAQIATLRKPLLFGQVGDYERADTLIETLYERTGITLDAGEITAIDNGAITVALNLRDQRARGKAFTDTLTEMGEQLQTVLMCIEPLKFASDPTNPHRILTTLRYRSKPKATISDINKLWKTSDQFISTVSKWRRIRVTGGSESGKSPLAELIAAALVQTKPDTVVSLAFPIENSVKNWWTIPVTHTSVKALAKSLQDISNRRAEGIDKTKMLQIGICDETDTALANDKELPAILKELLKTGSHTNVGIILVGQNANVSNYKGLQRSDFENCVSAHIGANSYHAIANSDYSEDEKKKLTAKCDKLVAYCETANKDMDTDSDSDKLERFALVTEPGKSPYFIQLPRFGSLVIPPTVAAEASTKPTVTECPKCNGTKSTKNGKTADGLQRVKCSGCRHSYTQKEG